MFHNLSTTTGNNCLKGHKHNKQLIRYIYTTIFAVFNLSNILVTEQQLALKPHSKQVLGSNLPSTQGVCIFFPHLFGSVKVIMKH